MLCEKSSPSLFYAQINHFSARCIALSDVVSMMLFMATYK